jgi:hypothetical protein
VQHKHLRFGHGFRMVLGNGRTQAAQMTLAPGQPRAGRAAVTAAPTSGCTS